jgi:hypothetical protein
VLAVSSDDGSVYSADIRRPGVRLAHLQGLHDGPVWGLTSATALVSAGAGADSRGRGGAAAEAAARGSTEVPVLLSCGEDGCLRATRTSALRGIPSSAEVAAVSLFSSPVPPAGWSVADSGAAAGASAAADVDSWTVLSSVHPLRNVSAVERPGGLVVAGDGIGRLHVTRLAR